MSRRFKLLTPLIGSMLLFSACSRSTESEKETTETQEPPVSPAEKSAAPRESAPETFKVQFTTSRGPFIVEVHRDWAPIGAERFHNLVKSGYYDGARFFRVVPDFVIQFGLAADPAVTKKWDVPIQDDPVVRTNRAGSLAFATMGPGTRTAQVFINLRSNQSLDSQGFAPFAQVVEGMDVVAQIYSGYGEAPDQEAITRSGNSYLNKNFPKLDYIRTAKIL